MRRADPTGAGFLHGVDAAEALTQYRALVEVVDAGIFQLDATGHFVTVDGSTADALGYDRESLLDEHASVVFDPADVERVDDDLRERLPNEDGEEVAVTPVGPYDVTAETADGDLATGTLHVVPLVSEGELRGQIGIIRDVVARERTAPDRRDREHQRSALLDRVPCTLYRCRNERGWPMEYVSDGIRELTGYDPAALERGEVSYGEDIVRDADRDRLWREIQRGLEADGSFLVTYGIETSDGDVRWVRERGRRTSEGAGDRELLEGVIVDVTEHKHLEAELDEILGRVTDAFYALDDSFRFTHVNERAETLLQADEESLLGEVLWDLYPDAADIDPVWEAFHTAMETQEPQHYEVYFDPLEFWVEATVYPSETGLSVYFRDVTERKAREQAIEESERHYRTLAEYFPNGLVTLFDHSLTYTLAAGQGFDRIPVDPEDLEGRPFHEVWPEETTETLEPVFEAALRGEEASVELEYADRNWILHGVPITDERGDVFAGMTMAQDITERRAFQRKLESTVEQLEASNDRLEQFAYAASHDLQEPLRMVTSYLQLIDQRYGDALDDDGEEFLGFAVDGAERMRGMIDGLLEYARVDTHGDPFEPVDLDAVAADVIEDLQLRIAEHDAEVSVDSLPTVRGDRSQLRQVFQNLLNNAIEYSGEEPPRVRITAERRGREWEITVSDDGIGIDPNEADYVFEMFKSLSANTAGTGIGLALCKRIVDRHGGDIRVESEPGDGSTFAFTLPVVSEEEE